MKKNIYRLFKFGRQLLRKAWASVLKNMDKMEFDWINSRLKEAGLNREACKWEKLAPLLDVDFSAFRVVAVGQQNGGKSTLLNALCGRTDLDWFETGDRIVTRDIKVKEHDGVVFVDTPGLDTADTRDDQKSWLGSQNACVVLFVHSCAAGELDANEYERLREFAARLQSPSRQLIVLCSKDGEIMEREKLDRIVAAVRAQTDKATGGQTRVMSIDSMDYIEGMRDNEDRLMKSSNIPDLKLWMNEQRDIPNRAERTLEAVKAEIAEALKTHQGILRENLSLSEERRRHLGPELLNKWYSLRDNSIKPAWDRCVQCIESIESLKRKL